MSTATSMTNSSRSRSSPAVMSRRQSYDDPSTGRVQASELC
jgi:hypothetical protein